MPFASLAAVWLYFALMHSSARQATLGKMAFGIKVTDLAGERVSFLRATGRYFATWVSSILLAVGFLMAGLTARKQALHDMIAGTLVVRADANPESVQAGGTTMPVGAGVLVVAILLGPLPLIGIMAAIAIPSYQDYLTRAQLTESVMEARNARAAVEAHYAQKRELPAQLSETGYRPASPNVIRVDATFAGPTIEIRAVPGPAVRVASTGGAVLMRSPAPPAPFEWKCSGYNIPNKYLPVNCRE
jgi:Tfp pilus assembly protein PilE